MPAARPLPVTVAVRVGRVIAGYPKAAIRPIWARITAAEAIVDIGRQHRRVVKISIVQAARYENAIDTRI